VSVAGDGHHLEQTHANVDAGINAEEGDVEGATTEVENEHRPPFAADGHLVQAVRDGGGGGLVDDAHDVQAGDCAGVYGGLALRVVEVDRDGDHGVLDRGAEVHLGGLPHLGEHHGGDLLGHELLLFAFVLHRDHRAVVTTCDDFERPQLDIFLYNLVTELAADQSLYFCKNVVMSSVK